MYINQKVYLNMSRESRRKDKVLYYRASGHLRRTNCFLDYTSRWFRVVFQRMEAKILKKEIQLIRDNQIMLELWNSFSKNPERKYKALVKSYNQLKRFMIQFKRIMFLFRNALISTNRAYDSCRSAVLKFGKNKCSF